MTTVPLPGLPKDKEFEEFLAAYFQCIGLYVQRNVIDRQEEEVLELDIIATSYSNNSKPDSILVEVKSGEWGFVDIFKIRGWLDYIDFEKGALLVRVEFKKPIELIQRIANSLNVIVIPIPNLAETHNKIAPLISGATPDQSDIDIWRYANWTERQIIRRLIVKKKSDKTKKCYQVLARYWSLINDKTFFTQNLVERAEKVYETFQDYPNISAKMGSELEGKNFDANYDNVPKELYEKTYYDCELTDLMISTFVEHRARLAVFKAAIDYWLFRNQGHDQNQKYVTEFGNARFEVSLLNLLPPSFLEGMEEIASHPFYFRYPVFWQCFLWFFGGFILRDHEEQEFELLSQKTGIPIKEIPKAFQSYEILFPRHDSWFMELKANNIRLMKLFPVPFMGVGAIARRMFYGKDRGWEGISSSALHTLDDLKKWNTVLVSLLEWKG